MKLPSPMRVASPLQFPSTLLHSQSASANPIHKSSLKSPGHVFPMHQRPTSHITDQPHRKPQINREDELASLLKFCDANQRSLGVSIHGCSLKTGCLQLVFLCNRIIQMYCKFDTIDDAHQLFDELMQPNIVSWTLMISGYARRGDLTEALALYRRMQQGEEERVVPNQFTFGSILKCCTELRDLETGIQIHGSTVKFGFDLDTFIASTMVDMYSKCGEIEVAWRVFSQTSSKDVVAWTSMITGFVHHGQQFKAFGLFKDMVCHGIEPVGVTFASLVKIFDEPKMLKQAKQVHGTMIKLGVKLDVLLGSSLVTMYGKCAEIGDAVRVSVRLDHRDVVTWTSLLVAHIQNGFDIETLEIFRKMVREKIKNDSFVIASVVGACFGLKELGIGKQIHGYAIRTSFISDISVSNAVITLYARCGEVKKAETVFEQIPNKDYVSWTALIAGYAQNRYGEEALLVFRRMLRRGLKPSMFSITSAIRACSTIATHAMGNQIHSRIIKTGFVNNISVENSLITMYAKCGSIDLASMIFNSMIIRDVISWNAIISGFSQHGFGEEALKLFYQMQQEGMEPDDFTFLGVLVACSHVGFVSEGCKYFKSMISNDGLEPKMEHYACMVDLFGRAGRLNDAIEFINSMPCNPDLSVWEALLASCKVHGNIEIGKFAAEAILELRPKDPSAYVLLSNIHASKGMWDKKAEVLTMMKGRGVRKEPSRSWVESRGVVHAFSIGDKSHPQTPWIYSKLEELKIKMKEDGYMPDTNFVLHDIGQEQKEYSLLHHCEKLAVAFALIDTVRGSTIRIMKNLRVCGDCHTAMKLISKIEDREIVLRDTNRFHHFVCGVCSCRDYW